MLLRSLLKFNTAWKAILMSAAVFGSFHVLSNSVIAIDRLIPTTLIGIVLGYLAYKSNSIFPGIILHSLNNGIVVFLAYFQPKLTKEYAWFPGDQDSIPVSWVLVGAAVAAIGLTLVWLSRPDEADVRESELDATPKPLVEAG
jgi:membrane protease YdiL (CAAX protease family)